MNEEEKKRYSRNLGRIGGVPPIFGPAINLSDYYRGVQDRKANEAFLKGLEGPTAVGRGKRYSGRPSRSGSRGGGLLVLFVVIGVVWFLAHSGSSNSSTPASPNYSSTEQTPAITQPVHTPPPVGQVIADAVTHAAASGGPPAPSTWSGQASPPVAAANTAPVGPIATQNTISHAAPPTFTSQAAAGPASSTQGAMPDTYANAMRELRPHSLTISNAAFSPQGMAFSATHRGSNECGGELTLSASNLVFRCEEYPGRDIRVMRSEVAEADSDGIKTVYGKKYHFKIKDLNKGEVETLFEEWFLRTAPTQTAQTTP